MKSKSNYPHPFEEILEIARWPEGEGILSVGTHEEGEASRRASQLSARYFIPRDDRNLQAAMKRACNENLRSRFARLVAGLIGILVLSFYLYETRMPAHPAIHTAASPPPALRKGSFEVTAPAIALRKGL